MAKIIDIEGIGEVYAGKLQEIGIETTDQLLKCGVRPQDRNAIAEATGISGKLVLEWVNRADLFRIKGVAEEYSDLLEVAGVDTVPELAQRNPENLHKKLGEANAEKQVVRRLPSKAQVADWVAQAKDLDRVITY
jgi:predicted flap endonuclease-1-like 5' DNA nuclease